jgi:hypothetical protein
MPEKIYKVKVTLSYKCGCKIDIELIRSRVEIEQAFALKVCCPVCCKGSNYG